jgi:hypothetical protein
MVLSSINTRSTVVGTYWYQQVAAGTTSVADLARFKTSKVTLENALCKQGRAGQHIRKD